MATKLEALAAALLYPFLNGDGLVSLLFLTLTGLTLQAQVFGTDLDTLRCGEVAPSFALSYGIVAAATYVVVRYK
uniref:Transmembrane protein n=1 Tax=Marseillevirus LCMAC103 TaxID=2506604 RepID=A0A481YW97_9VIRU|nr:MAG: hypothetical protein LCMAC103_01820 [Marseillevirus LCMAC103]